VGAQQIRLAVVVFEIPEAPEEPVGHWNEDIALPSLDDRLERVAILHGIKPLVFPKVVESGASLTSPCG
jgi:hypothetical protein